MLFLKAFSITTLLSVSRSSTLISIFDFCQVLENLRLVNIDFFFFFFRKPIGRNQCLSDPGSLTKKLDDNPCGLTCCSILYKNTLMLLKICWGNIQGIETCRDSIRYSPLLAQILLIERGLFTTWKPTYSYFTLKT